MGLQCAQVLGEMIFAEPTLCSDDIYIHDTGRQRTQSSRSLGLHGDIDGSMTGFTVAAGHGSNGNAEKRKDERKRSQTDHVMTIGLKQVFGDVSATWPLTLRDWPVRQCIPQGPGHVHKHYNMKIVLTVVAF